LRTNFCVLALLAFRFKLRLSAVLDPLKFFLQRADPCFCLNPCFLVCFAFGLRFYFGALARDTQLILQCLYLTPRTCFHLLPFATLGLDSLLALSLLALARSRFAKRPRLGVCMRFGFRPRSGLGFFHGLQCGCETLPRIGRFTGSARMDLLRFSLRSCGGFRGGTGLCGRRLGSPRAAFGFFA
jgi:hypothetical protein